MLVLRLLNAPSFTVPACEAFEDQVMLLEWMHLQQSGGPPDRPNEGAASAPLLLVSEDLDIVLCVLCQQLVLWNNHFLTTDLEMV